MPEPDVKEKTFRDALFSGKMDMEGMDSVLALYRELYSERTLSEQPGAQWRIPEKDEIAVRLGGGFTILDPAQILPEPEELARRGKDVSLVLARHSEDPASITRAMDHVMEDPSSFLRLARASALHGEPSPEEEEGPFKDVNREILSFLVFNATKGLFLRAAQKVEEIGTKQWDHGRCPLCGGGPAVAFLLGEGGKRYLLCHRCETRWRYRRMACPYCEKPNSKESRYVYIEEPEYKGVTGQVCDECKKYIKTWRVEGEELEGFHPEVEDLKTPGFDAALEAEGFHRGAANIFGVRVGLGTKDG